MSRAICLLMYGLFWLWIVLGLLLNGDILSGILNFCLGVILYFIIFSGIWKKKQRKTTFSSDSSESTSFWDLFISDSSSDSSTADTGGDGGGGGGD
nr:hypothetical protein [uncultured Bacillus sp.]